MKVVGRCCDDLGLDLHQSSMLAFKCNSASLQPRFQIEHHLFPQLPRHNLSKAGVVMRALFPMSALRNWKHCSGQAYGSGHLFSAWNSIPINQLLWSSAGRVLVFSACCLCAWSTWKGRAVRHYGFEGQGLSQLTSQVLSDFRGLAMDIVKLKMG